MKALIYRTKIVMKVVLKPSKLIRRLFCAWILTKQLMSHNGRGYVVAVVLTRDLRKVASYVLSR